MSSVCSEQPKHIVKISYKQLYQNELTRRKNLETILEQKEKIFIGYIIHNRCIDIYFFIFNNQFFIIKFF